VSHAPIVAEDRPGATRLTGLTGLTIDGAISSYHLIPRAGNKSPTTIKTSTSTSRSRS